MEPPIKGDVLEEVEVDGNPTDGEVDVVGVLEYDILTF
jgi:hypothetical protein